MNMSIDQKVQLSLIVLLTGLVIVFAMLIFLTFIIKGYSATIRSIMSKNNSKKADTAIDTKPEKEDVKVNESSDVSYEVPSEQSTNLVIEEGIPEEVVAAISAAVYTMYGTSTNKVTHIRRSVQSNRSAWGMAGLLDSTRPILMDGLF